LQVERLGQALFDMVLDHIQRFHALHGRLERGIIRRKDTLDLFVGADTGTGQVGNLGI
jgi:hypothetical protein